MYGENKMQFGFSYVGLIYLLMLFVPNGFWAKYRPVGYDEIAKNENRVLGIFERSGEICVSTLVLIFSDFNVRICWWALFLTASFGLMILYEIYWIKYFKSEKKLQDFYTSICGIPLAGATLPVCAFFLLGVYGKNIFLMVASVILGIGHIGIHYGHWKEIADKNN